MSIGFWVQLPWDCREHAVYLCFELSKLQTILFCLEKESLVDIAWCLLNMWKIKGVNPHIFRCGNSVQGVDIATCLECLWRAIIWFLPTSLISLTYLWRWSEFTLPIIFEFYNILYWSKSSLKLLFRTKLTEPLLGWTPNILSQVAKICYMHLFLQFYPF